MLLISCSTTCLPLLILTLFPFLVERSLSQTLGRLFARALQLHPRNPGLWIKAASWEFFDGGNASSARSLMQRALRINPTAQNLWLQYFRLEFSYVEKLTGRREILGLKEEEEGAGKAVGGGRQSMDIPELEAEEGQSGGPSFTAVKKAAAAAAGGGATVGGDGSARPAPVMNDTARRFYKGAVPMAVFRAAIKAIPEDVGFRAGFLRCCAVDFPVLAREAAQAVLASIERDFPESCEAWELRALYPLMVAEVGGGGGGSDKNDGLGPTGRESVAVFERAVEAVGAVDPDMWVRYADFLRGRLEACEEQEETRRSGGGGAKKRKGSNSSSSSSMVQAPPSAFAAAAAALAARLKEVLARAVDIHLAASFDSSSSSSSSSSTSNGGGKRAAPTATTVVAAAIAARKKRGGASLLATRGVSTSAAELEAAERRRAENAREALSAGLADVCLALGEPKEALAALRSATQGLPRRPGPWLRRAALERRLAAVIGDGDGDGDGGGDGNQGGGSAAGAKRRLTYSSGGGRGSGSGSSTSSSAGGSDSHAAKATLLAGLKAVPPTDPDYPSLWRELIASAVASGSSTGGGKNKNAVAAAFRGAVEACNPSAGEGGGDPAGTAQGEFLAGYIRWAAAVDGVDAARWVLQWARRSFLLSGAGAAAAYNEAIELERAVGEVGGGAGAARAKRVRELFEVRFREFWMARSFVVVFGVVIREWATKVWHLLSSLSV